MIGDGPENKTKEHIPEFFIYREKQELVEGVSLNEEDRISVEGAVGSSPRNKIIMTEGIDVFGTDWDALKLRRQELKELSDMGNLFDEEAIELVEINQQFSLLEADFEAKKSSTEGRFHPWRKFLDARETTNKRIQECLEAGEPVVISPRREEIITVNPNWNKAE